VKARQPSERASGRQEFIRASRFDDPPILQQLDAIGPVDVGQPMGYRHDGAAAAIGLDRPEYQTLGVGIQAGEGLIQKEYRRIF
jgi:hypothetical protein